MPSRSLVLPGLAALILVAALSVPVVAQSESEVPPCDAAEAAVTACRLGGWPAEGPATLPTIFGAPDLAASVWVDDPTGDAPAGGLDVLGVGIARVPVEDAASLRRASDVLRAGNRRQAVRDGEALLIRTVLASAPDAIADGHAGVFVATDVDGVLSNDAPSGVDAPDGPFAGLQEVFSLNVAAGDAPDLLFSDLSRGWYQGRQAYAAHRPAPEVVDMLVRPESVRRGAARRDVRVERDRRRIRRRRDRADARDDPARRGRGAGAHVSRGIHRHRAVPRRAARRERADVPGHRDAAFMVGDRDVRAGRRGTRRDRGAHRGR